MLAADLVNASVTDLSAAHSDVATA
eukprot:COSAG01_NODE_68109_length_265_cov_0.614458_1_plen_24_part_10